VIGIGAWVVLLPAALLLRRAPTPAAGPGDAGRPGSIGGVLRSRPFIVLAATFFTCCATHSGPIFHTVSYAIGCGLPTIQAVTIYSMEGAAGLGGRLVFGLLGDRFGAKRVLIGGLLLQAVAAGSYLLVRRLDGFYTVAFVFGLAYGGVMPLYAVLAREYFGTRVLGTVLGAATMLSSLGMALGPVAGGWIFDHYGSYSLMYMSSLAVGLGATLMAFGFPAPRDAALMRPVGA
jgi:MFS family permease